MRSSLGIDMCGRGGRRKEDDRLTYQAIEALWDKRQEREGRKTIRSAQIFASQEMRNEGNVSEALIWLKHCSQSARRPPRMG